MLKTTWNPFTKALTQNLNKHMKLELAYNVNSFNRIQQQLSSKYIFILYWKLSEFVCIVVAVL